jgi:hypothetical protein
VSEITVGELAVAVKLVTWAAGSVLAGGAGSSLVQERARKSNAITVYEGFFISFKVVRTGIIRKLSGQKKPARVADRF